MNWWRFLRKSTYRSRPVTFTISDFQTLPAVFAPIRKIVAVLIIQFCSSSQTTSKLPSLKIPNLLALLLVHCDGLAIKKQDFGANPKLRMIGFLNVTIENIEPETFTNLPDLKWLSLEFAWKKPCTSQFATHLLRFHCNCDYTWFREWLRQSPVVISSKKEYEIFRIFFYGNYDMNRKETFVPIDCANTDLNAVSFDESQLSYSVNDDCNNR